VTVDILSRKTKECDVWRMNTSRKDKTQDFRVREVHFIYTIDKEDILNAIYRTDVLSTHL